MTSGGNGLSSFGWTLGGDADAEAGQGRVVGDAIALRGHRQSLDRRLRQSVRVQAASGATPSAHFPIGPS